ncbi:folate-binding protein YgfZ [Candidatus Pseudothioglobus singularis]|nr:folate-binding protein YgfZ [Candidatus Pseudothioglobus singularis]
MRVHLKNRSLLSVSGSDSKSFLQGQLSNDISKLGKSEIQINAYCQHQGKIIGLFWVMRYQNGFLLSFPNELLDKIKSRLEMFVIISDVVIEDFSHKLFQLGLIEEQNRDAYILNDSLSVLITENLNNTSEYFSDIEEWDKSSFDSSIPEIFAITSEKLVPQMLNLDINEIGVNFSKGCYPGQEVVARLHYLGSAKRRLFSFKADQEMQVGDSLYCSTSKTALARGNRYKGSGIVVSKVKYNSLFYCLATLDVDLIDEIITLNNEHGSILERIYDE